jgi:hypothetical protein
LISRNLIVAQLSGLCFLVLSIFLAGGQAATNGPASNSEEPVIPNYFGLHIHHAADTTPWPAVPFAQWRLWDAYVAWPFLEPRKGQWRFETLDKDWELANHHGVGLLLPLGLSPDWASSRPDEKSAYHPGNAAEPKDLEDWRNYVRTVASRYKGRIHNYEIWNEPNLKEFWTGDVDQMIALTREASHMIHEIDPGATLVSPSATGPQGVDWLREFLAKGGGQYVDVIGYHFYVTPRPPETMVPLIGEVKRAMEENGIGEKPIWDTETGWAAPKPFPSPELAAAYLARAYLLAWSSGVRRFYWYSWDNHTWVTIQTTEADNRTLTPAGHAYAVIHDWLVGGRLDECREDAGHTWRCHLEHDGATEWIVWNPGGKKSIDLQDLHGAKSVTPLLGERRRLLGSNLEVSETPILISSAEP